jgi:hypothetical protein
MTLSGASYVNTATFDKRVGRPRVAVNASRIVSLRHQRRSWAEITRETGISKGTAQGALAGLPKTLVADTSPSA